MKNIIAVIAFLFAIAIQSTSFAQANKDLTTTTIKVEGVCSACKKRIENAAYIPGVKEAIWDKESSLLTVTYRTSKTNTDKIATEVAKAGHHAGDVKADRATYNKLPSCCAYESNHKH